MEMRRREMQQYSKTPQHPSLGASRFRSPKRPSLGAFRTPQHPSLRANNWGGASPLLARNIPQESLEQRYLRLNNVRIRDEMIFQLLEDQDDFYLPKIEASKPECPPTPIRIRGFLRKLWYPRKHNATPMPAPAVSSKKKRTERWDPKKRWPNGWY